MEEDKVGREKMDPRAKRVQKSLLKRAYRLPFDQLEEVTTGTCFFPFYQVSITALLTIPTESD